MRSHSGIPEQLRRAEAFKAFHEQLRRLYVDLHGEAKLESLEHWLSINVKGDGLGHFEASRRVRDEPGFGNELAVRLLFDQTELPAVPTGLEQIAISYPVTGVAKSP